MPAWCRSRARAAACSSAPAGRVQAPRTEAAALSPSARCARASCWRRANSSRWRRLPAPGSASTSPMPRTMRCSASCTRSAEGKRMETILHPTSSTSSKRREVKRDKVEGAILAEAVRLFAEHGYEGTAIADVAERAGLSKQNLMYYFPTKQALYTRVPDDVLDDWLARMASLAG